MGEHQYSFPAPIALFVYDRPHHLRRVVASLLANPLVAQTALYVFSDAPREIEAKRRVDEVRAYIATISGFSSVHVVCREFNFGLARSIIDGVSSICDKFQRVIVLEDDLLVSPHFLQFMNQGLDMYAENTRVASIHGYVYPVAGGMPDTFFLRGADCWGWATWKRAWDKFCPDGEYLLRHIQQNRLEDKFNMDGAYPYVRMLKRQVAGKNNSWAIRWYASAFLADMCTLYPGRSLVQNIGMDGSGIHCSVTEDFAVNVSLDPITLNLIEVVENQHARSQIIKFFRKTEPPIIKKIWRRAFALMKNFLKIRL